MKGLLNNFYLSEGKFLNTLNYCIQFSWFVPYFGSTIFSANAVLLNENYYYMFNLILLGNLFSSTLSHSKNKDHAGFTFDVVIIGISFSFMIYDRRHWDYENDRFEIFN